MKKQLDIEHTCQCNNSIPEEWHVRVCGLACVKMILGHRKIKNSLLDLLNEGQSIGAYNPSIGWDHNGLVRLLRNHGVSAYSQEFRSVEIDIESGEMNRNPIEDEFVEKGLKKIRESIDNNNPVMVSVFPGFGDNNSPHLVLITGYNEEGLFFHDPDNSKGEIKKAYPISREHFLRFWRLLGIFIDD
jgi:hypothetical protein